MQRSHTASPGVYGRAVAAVRPAEQLFFAGFTFDGDTNLEALASFYGLIVPELEPGITLAEYFARTCHGRLRPGYRIALGNAALIVREIEKGVIRKAGLGLLPMALRQRRRRRPYGNPYNFRDRHSAQTAAG